MAGWKDLEGQKRGVGCLVIFGS